MLALSSQINFSKGLSLSTTTTTTHVSTEASQNQTHISNLSPSQISLKDMLHHGHLKTGKCLTITYKGAIITAELLATGNIKWNGNIYSSPSSFSLAAKKSLNPAIAADSGWNSVKYKGRRINDIRKIMCGMDITLTRTPRKSSGASKLMKIGKRKLGNHEN